MRAVRFGSYSIVDTFAGMSRLSRLKSITRYIRLWPPPRHHDVSCPWLLRPPVARIGSTSGFYGPSGVGVAEGLPVLERRPRGGGIEFAYGHKNPNRYLVHL